MNNIVNSSNATNPQEYRLVDDIVLNHETRITETSNCNQIKVGFRPGEEQPMKIKADLNPANIVSVFDVAQYVLSRLEEPCTTMKLHSFYIIVRHGI